MNTITLINWKNDITQFGPLTTKTERQYDMRFRSLFKKTDNEIKNYLLLHNELPSEQIQTLIEEFNIVFSKDNRVQITYYDELLQNEIYNYEKVAKSIIYREALAIELQCETEENKYRIEVTVKDDNDWLHQKKGDVITQINLEAFSEFDHYWSYLVNVDAAFFLIGYVRNFDMAYGELSKRAVQEELKEIDDFIESANKLTLKDAFSDRSNDKKAEIIKLTNGYYKKKYNQESESILNKVDGYNTLFSPVASIVYAKYILYKSWLAKKLTSFKSEKEQIEEQLEKFAVNLRTGVELNEIFLNSIDEVKILSKDYKVRFDQVEVLFNFKTKHLPEVKRWIKRYEEQKELNLSTFEDEYKTHYSKFDKQYWKTFKPNGIRKITDVHFLIVFGKNIGKAFLKDIKPSKEQTAISNQNNQQKAEQKSTRFMNNFDHVSADKIYDYFHEGLVKANLLSERDLILYLTSAFQNDSIPEQKFVFNSGKTKKYITHIFYKYFTEVGSKPHGEKPRYVKLLSNYFTGFNFQSTFDNFSKGGY